MERWQAANTQVLGISIDSVYAHRAFAKELNLEFPLLADFHPKGDVARKYGVYRDERGYAQRSIFIIDGDGVLRWSKIFLGDMPNMNQLQGVLDDLNAVDPRATVHRLPTEYRER